MADTLDDELQGMAQHVCCYTEEEVAELLRRVQHRAWWDGVYAQWLNVPPGNRVLEHTGPYWKAGQ